MRINGEVITGVFKYSPDIEYTKGDLIIDGAGGIYKVMGDVKGIPPSSQYPYQSCTRSFGPDSDDMFDHVFTGLRHDGTIDTNKVPPGSVLSISKSGVYRTEEGLAICVMGQGSETKESLSYLIIFNSDVVSVYKDVGSGWTLLNSAGNISKSLRDKITAIDALKTLLQQKLAQVEILNRNLAL